MFLIESRQVKVSSNLYRLVFIKAPTTTVPFPGGSVFRVGTPKDDVSRVRITVVDYFYFKISSIVLLPEDLFVSEVKV